MCGLRTRRPLAEPACRGFSRSAGVLWYGFLAKNTPNVLGCGGVSHGRVAADLGCERGARAGTAATESEILEKGEYHPRIRKLGEQDRFATFDSHPVPGGCTVFDYTAYDARRAFETMTEDLDNHDWHYDPEPEKLAVRSGFKGNNHVFAVHMYVEDDDPVLILSIIPRLFVPEKKRAVVSELIARLNWGLRVGRWDMDLEDGEIRFTTVHVFGEQGLEAKGFAYVCAASFATADRHFPAFGRVIFADMEPSEAAARSRSDAGPGDQGESAHTEDETERLRALVHALQAELGQQHAPGPDETRKQSQARADDRRG